MGGNRLIQFVVVGLKLVRCYMVYSVNGYQRHDKGTIFAFAFAALGYLGIRNIRGYTNIVGCCSFECEEFLSLMFFSISDINSIVRKSCGSLWSVRKTHRYICVRYVTSMVTQAKVGAGRDTC